jgi:hypothetical protein
MTPYSLEEAKRKAEQDWSHGGTLRPIFDMLAALLQHEADRAAEKNLSKPR